jgi:hypothetical protein
MKIPSFLKRNPVGFHHLIKNIICLIFEKSSWSPFDVFLAGHPPSDQRRVHLEKKSCKIHQKNLCNNKICMNFHKILLKFTKTRMDFQLTNVFGEFYMIFSLSVEVEI